MSAPTATLAPATIRRGRPPVAGPRSAFTTLTRRRLALSARTPRELLVPLLTPILFALVIAPALASIGPTIPGVDYMSFAAVGTVGLLIPLNCMFSGIGVILDRESGARRDLLAAPMRRPLIVLANLAVALMITALPWAMTAFARLLPLTHALALMRYGLLGHNASGLHDIWGMSNATTMAALSIAVVAGYAVVFTAVALRTFRASVES